MNGDALAKTMGDIEKYGWSSVGVMPTVDDDDGSPTFTYTIGFQEHDHPELIVIGLHPEQAHAMLWTFYARVAEGEVFEPGDRVSEILDGYDVLIGDVPPDGHPLNMARAYYGVDELPALQVLWPDKEGRFPGDPGFAEKFEGRQDLEAART